MIRNVNITVYNFYFTESIKLFLAVCVIQKVPTSVPDPGTVLVSPAVVGFARVPMEKVAMVTGVKLFHGGWKPPISLFAAVGNADPSSFFAVADQIADHTVKSCFVNSKLRLIFFFNLLLKVVLNLSYEIYFVARAFL